METFAPVQSLRDFWSFLFLKAILADDGESALKQYKFILKNFPKSVYAPQAAMKIVNIMNSDEPIPQANMRLQAAQSILDRIGLSKTDRIDVTHKTDQGLFILPAKKETVINGEYEEAQG